MGMNEGEQIDDREHRNNQHPKASPVPAFPEKPQHYITNHDDKSVCYKGRNEKTVNPRQWTTLYFTPCPSTSFPAFEPNSTNCEYRQLFRHIQYRRTASFLAMATLAILFSRRIIRCIYRRRQCCTATFGCRIGTIKKSANYEISGASQRRASARR